MAKKHPMSRKDSIVVQEANGEVLIYDLNENKAFCLNETSALIWDLCNGNRSLSEISQELSKRLNSHADEGLVWLALEQLKKEKLIESEITAPAAYLGMSRREVIRKVGLASIVTLPVVASLVAPTGAMAASVACIPFTSSGCTPTIMCCTPTNTCTPAPGTRFCCVGPGKIANGSVNEWFEENTPNTILCVNTPFPTRDSICAPDFSSQCCSGHSTRFDNSCFTSTAWRCGCSA